jgi:hypothetical protein
MRICSLKRGPDGSFSDDDIANVLQSATETVAGAYRARGHPAVFRVIEVMSMMQGRQWGVCSMNEFREFLGLKKFNDFEDWSSNPEIAVSLGCLHRYRVRLTGCVCRTQPGSCMGTSTTSSSTLVFRLKTACHSVLDQVSAVGTP